MKLGIQISSVKKYLENEQDVLASFKKVSQIGYKYIQIQWISPDVSPEFIKSALAETNLTCVGTQDYFDEVIPNLDNIIKMNDLWGGGDICVSRIPDRYHSLDGCMQLASEINEAIKIAESKGKTLSFHPIWTDYQIINGKPMIETLLENTKLQIVLDAYHANKAGLDVVDIIKKWQGKIQFIHFKDMKINDDGTEELTPVGQGQIDWDSIIKACIETGVKYCFAEQERWQKDPFVCLKDSHDFIADRLKGQPT